VNEALGNPPTVAPITAVDGFECKLVSPVDNTLFFQLTETFGGNAINVGIAPDYVVGFAESVPVTGNAVVLVTWSFMAVAPGTYDFFLDITDIPGIPGVMSVVDGNEVDNNLVPVYRSTNDDSVPVFSVNGDNAVAVESQSFGSIKSLFR